MLARCENFFTFARNGKLRPDGRMVHDMYLVEVRDPKQVQTSGDYYDVTSVIPGDRAFKSMEEGNCACIKGNQGDGDKQADKGGDKDSA